LRNKKEDRRSQRTRRLLHRAIMSLMQEKRYDSITVQDIIDRADVGRSTFYAHYQDKEDLVDSNLQEILDDLSQSLADSGPESQRLLPTLALFRHVQENRRLFEAMHSGGELDLLLEKGQVYWRQRVEAELQARLQPGQKSAMPLSLVADYLSATLGTYLKWWLGHQPSYAAERMDEMFQQMVMPGVWAALGQDGPA
jgi:AcrR family transcriptional regulator